MWGLLLFFLLLMSCSRSSENGDIQRLSHEVYAMRQCQQRADNLNFYLHKYQADKLLQKYDAKDTNAALRTARVRYSIVYADYLMQIGSRNDAIAVLDSLASLDYLKNDTLLWLNYLSHQGEVNYFPYAIQRHRQNIERGYDCLVQCYIFSTRNHIDLYQAVSMQHLSRYLLNDSIREIARQFDPASLRYLNEDGIADSLLAGNLAQRALNILLQQRNYSLTANAWRNLATCYFYIGDAQTAIQCLHNALANPAIDSMPDLKASISEQMSMSYAALDDKPMSDYYRNQYLDLQDSTRQDRQYEARLISLERNTHRIWLIVGVAFVCFIILCLLSILLVRLRHRMADRIGRRAQLDEMQEQISMLRLQADDARRALVEQRARVSIIKGMLPLIERLKTAAKSGDNDYLRALLADIDSQNTMLTEWIKLHQGKVQPRIETFPLAEVFKIIATSSSSLSSRGISLVVEQTTAMVKADKSLTLFILNTLVDNARKAKSHSITLKTELTEGGGVTVSIEDDGCGMTEEQVGHLFEPKPICDERTATSHGFGLQNCRGIIERYRKLSPIFSVCRIWAVSTLGKGTRISFTLPSVLKTLLLALGLSLGLEMYASSELTRYSDSLYQCNVEGRFEQAMHYADSCRDITHNSLEVPEEQRGTYLSIYNETAVASLALHQWRKYQYYNYLYTHLYKQSTQDPMLPSYCRDMERGELMANISMLVVLLLILSLFPLLWFLFIRPLMRQKRKNEQERQRLEDELAKQDRDYYAMHVQNCIISNQLSTIKHETMYYPTRITQLMGNDTLLTANELNDTVDYYSRLYSMLSSPLLGDDGQHNYFPVGRQKIGKSDDGEDIIVLINPELYQYLLVLLKRHGYEVKGLSAKDASYAALKFIASTSDHSSLFTPSSPHTDYLVMRQIVRETADSTNAYGAGISALTESGTTIITVVLPRA